MDVVYRRCCGMDIHKDQITATVRIVRDNGKTEIKQREFPTDLGALIRLRVWLVQNKVEVVAMESTGVYWKPVWNVLAEGAFQMILANPRQIRNIPGEKTDARDSAWIAELLAHKLIRPSFVPPLEIAALRDLTRMRSKLKQDRTRLHNRISAQCEGMNLKLGSVVSDVLGVTGRLILKALLAGQEDPVWLADKARGTLRGKREELRRVLRCRVTEHDRFLLAELLHELEQVESSIRRIEQRLVVVMEPYEAAVRRLMTIPGVDQILAWILVAELGVDMSVFPDAAHAASWAGLVPGCNESAGKRKSTRTRKGNRWLRAALTQAAWAVTRKRDCYLTALFYRYARRMGQKKAIMAVAHQILLIAYTLLRDGTTYVEQGGDYFDRLNPERTKRRLTERLARLGYEFELRPRPASLEQVTPPSPKRPRGRPRKVPIT